MTENRVTIKISHPNPLFEKWITEWRDEENPHRIKQIAFYNEALNSLKKYPLVLQTGNDCLILKGFSKKLCSKLDNQLENQNTTNTTSKTPVKKPKNQKDPQKYCPAYRSGPYAILYTLYKNSQDTKGKKSMLKEEIIKIGQHYCDKSFTRPDPGSFYTAWSSMSTLITKELISKTGNPAKFSLTDDGILIARKLYTENTDEELIENINLIEPPDVLKVLEPKTKKKKTLIKHPSEKSTSGTSEDINKETNSQIANFVLAPYSFKTLLLVDQQETSGNAAKKAVYDEIILELNSLGVLYEVRHLKVGDYAWICRGQANEDELMLPFIVERKRMDDFGASIKDGRFHEQKFRLKQCGLNNLIYLVESYADNKHVGMPLNSIYQAATNTLVQDNFSVKFTNNIRETAYYLATFTKKLSKIFEEKTLASCAKDDLIIMELHEDFMPLMTFTEFNKGASKQKALKVKELFIRQLLQLKGVSVDRALAISDKYPCPRVLKEAFDDCIGEKQKENLLSEIQFGNLQKKIGPVISKSIFQLFTFPKY